MILLPGSNSITVPLPMTRAALVGLRNASQLKTDLRKNMRTDRELNKNQFSALCCLAYNIGVPRLLSYNLIKYIYIGNFERAANEFLDITNDGFGNLPQRRRAEVELFNSWQ